MSSTARMNLFVVFLVTLTATACGNKMPAPFEVEDRSPRADADAPFDPPNMYPGWAYDSEAYMKPAAPLTPEPRVKKGDPLHYFTNKKLVMIRQPAGYTPEEVPRVAIWWTDNNGFHWHKAGYFGREQGFFPFEVEEDGDYGIRFVGPGQPPALRTPAYPERVYHVDTTPPEVEVVIEPEQSWYHVGETVTISWRAEDYHLIEYPASIRMLMDFTADEPKVVELQRELADEGSIAYEIPPEALDHEIRFRVDAPDRAGNLGIVHSYALQVVEKPVPDDGEMEEVTADAYEMQEWATDADVPNAAGEWAETGGPAESNIVQWEVGATTESDTATDADVTTNVNDPREPIAPEGADGLSQDPSGAAEDGETQATRLYDGGPGTGFDSVSMEETVGAAADGWNGMVYELPKDGPARIPFASAVARLPTDEAPLTWDGETVVIPPSGEIIDSQRTTDGSFDANAGPADHETPEPDESEAAATLLHDTSESLVFPPNQSAVEDEEAAGARTDLCGQFRSVVPVVDPTHGNGLVIPLPATVEAKTSTRGLATAHPWRVLGDVLSSPLRTVWALPRARFGYELNHVFEGRLLADHPALRPVAEPGAVSRAIASLPADITEADPTILP